jgi:CheY-like chemotaxis protein/phosphoribosyl 1,2-cyclic phosphodiesterase
VRADDGTLVVLDSGTGAHALGAALVGPGDDPVRGHMLIGHTHWDHIQGFPFFAPLFVEGSEWDVYAPGGRSRQIQDALAGQMAYQYSPINLDSLHADLRYHDLTEGSFELGSVRVQAQYMNHPALTLGYRLEVDGAIVVYATDHEPHSLHPNDAPPGTLPIHREDQRHARFLEEADLVIHDAQYRLDEFPRKKGWGHTPIERAVDYAILARAKRLALFHHDPARDDDAVDRVCELARERARQAEYALEVFAAAEGEAIELSGSAPRQRLPQGSDCSALLAGSGSVDGTVLIVDDDPDMLRLLEVTLRGEGVRVITAVNGQAALEKARHERPTLVLLDMNLPDRDGIEVCRQLCAESDLQRRHVPILILTGSKLKETDLIEAFTAGATDYLTKPVKPTLVRSRVRSWLLRTPA